MRALKAGHPSLTVVGCNADRFVLKRSAADVNYVVPLRSAAFVRDLRRIINAEHIDIVIPNNEPDVATVSRLRAELRCRVFLPTEAIIERCRDKYRLHCFLSRRGLPVAETYPVISLDALEGLFERFEGASPLWCRLRRGTGSAAAIPVASPEHAYGWIKYWQDVRGVTPGLFILSEYLPGSDFTVQCLLRKGMVLMTKMYERLEYHVVGGTPSGVSSSAALARMVYEPAILDVCVRAVLAVAPKGSGVFFVDVKENSTKVPCITEINAGRFANVPTIHDAIAEDNMAAAYVRSAFDEPMEIQPPREYPESVYVTRALDTLPAVMRANDLFEDVREVKRRAPARQKAYSGKRH